MHEKVKIPKIFVVVACVAVAGLGAFNIFTRVKYGSYREQAQEYRREIAEGRETIGNLKSELEEAKGYIGELENGIERSERIIKELEAEIGKLEERIEQSKVHIRELEETNRILREASLELGSNLGSARTEIQQLIEDLQAEADTNGGN